MDLKRQPKVPAYSQVVGKIQHLIKSGQLGPGDQLLPERQLAEVLGVSRGSLREALAALAGMGVLEINPRDGAYVRRRSLDDAVDALAQALYQERQNVYHLFEVREIVETNAARLAAARATTADVQRLKAVCDSLEEHIKASQAAGQEDLNFHIALVAAAKNPLLSHVMEAVAQAMSEAYGPTRDHLMAVPERAQQFAREHRSIVEAIARGNAEVAQRRVERHLLHAREGFEEEERREFSKEVD